ncbi:MAG: DUF3108 domain-containing protein [Burkholderiaceae bacterium]
MFAVLLVHVFAMRWLAERAAEFKLLNVAPPRIEVVYVRELEMSAPPSVAPVAPKRAPAKKRVAASRPAPAASAPPPKAKRDTPLEPDTALAQASAPAAASAPKAKPDAPIAPDAVLAQATAPAAAPQATPDAPRAPEPTLAQAPALPEPAPRIEPEPQPVVASASPVTADAVVPSATAIAPAAESARVASSAVPPDGVAASIPAEAQTASATASAIEIFDWPTSTRMSYALTGYYRGEVLGSAQVEWIRSGARYQVHLDIVIGPSLTPLITRRMSSDGDITATGLSPRRYDEDTKTVFRDRRHVTMLFEADTVLMPSGERRERWPGVQDSASQFVQLTFLFTLNPELLRVGQQIDVPLALPKNIDRWTYDVVNEEVLHTPFGAVPAFHVKPRRITRPGGELSAEIWFAPQLRYLPVRIRIQQDAETFVDLLLDRRPQIASK